MGRKIPGLTAIILAAGEGTRMKSDIPKVLHTLGGRTLLDWVLRTAQTAGVKRRVVVLGHQGEAVAKTLPPGIETVMQSRQLGSAHAVQTAKSALAAFQGEVLVLCGDAPLINARTLRRLVREHRRLKVPATVLTAKVDNPRGYGRIIREPECPARVARIVEEREASKEERDVREVNSGAYCFSLPLLWKIITQVDNRNRKGEYYLTDIVELMRRRGYPVAGVQASEALEILGINRRQDLAQAAAVLNRRTLELHMDRGVSILDPNHTWIHPEVRVGRDTIIYSGTHLTGHTVIGAHNIIGPGTHLDSTRTGRRVRIKLSVVEHSWIGDQVCIGPFSHLRSGTHVGADVKIGNFAEINRSRINPGAKMGHVGYLGDCTVGRKANIGAGSITANYDGRQKHVTRIGAQAFIGSGTVLVGPCQVGRKALTGAGAVLKAGTRIPPATIAVGVPARVIKKR